MTLRYLSLQRSLFNSRIVLWKSVRVHFYKKCFSTRYWKFQIIRHGKSLKADSRIEVDLESLSKFAPFQRRKFSAFFHCEKIWFCKEETVNQFLEDTAVICWDLVINRMMPISDIFVGNSHWIWQKFRLFWFWWFKSFAGWFFEGRIAHCIWLIIEFAGCLVTRTRKSERKMMIKVNWK